MSNLNFSNCTAIILFLIIQLIILVYDFLQYDYFRAFVHFWLGFIFYVLYNKELCADSALGANTVLTILAFVLFQFFLINWALDIKKRSTDMIELREMEEEKDKKNTKKQQYEYLQSTMGMGKNGTINPSAVNPNNIAADVKKGSDEITLYSNANLSRGDVIYLADGQKRTIIGFSEGFPGNSVEKRKIKIKVDREFEKDYDKIIVKEKEKDNDDLRGMLLKNNESMEKLGVKETQLKRKKSEIEDNIKLLEEEKKKKKIKKEDTQQYDKDLIVQKNNLDGVKKDLNDIRKLREQLISKNLEINPKLEEEKNVEQPSLASDIWKMMR